MADVFVSYKTEDRALAQSIVSALERDGISVWWDQMILAGDVWRSEITTQLDNAQVVLVLWTPRSTGPMGRFVQEEASRAQRRGTYMALQIEDCELPLGFSETQAFRLAGWSGDDADPAFRAMLSGLRARLGRSSAALAAPADRRSAPAPPAPGLAAPPPLEHTERRSIMMLRVELLHSEEDWEDPDRLYQVNMAVKAILLRDLDRSVSMFQDLDDTGFVCLFGVPMADEFAAVNGVETALRLEQLLRTEAGVVTRMALASGSAIVSSSQSGGPPRITSRLRPKLDGLLRDAAQGQVVVTPPDQQRIAAFFKTTPTDAGNFVVIARNAVSDRITASEQRGLSPLVGRKSEMAEITRAIESARAGRGQALSLVGEAGMGKSRLLRETGELLDAGGFLAVASAGQSFGRMAPHAAFAVPLRVLLGFADAPGMIDADAITQGWPQLAGYAPYLVALINAGAREAQPQIDHSDSAMLIAATREAILAAVNLAADRKPLALLLDDYQFVDDATKMTVQALAGTIDHSRVLLLVAARPNLPPSWPPLAHCRQVVLSPLDVKATGLLLRAVAGARSSTFELAAIIHRRTDGVPFFIEELTRMLIASGEFAVNAGKLTAHAGYHAIDVPYSLEGLVRARLDQLDPGVRAIISTAAVIGQQFEWTILRNLLDLQGPPAEHLGTALALGIIRQVRIVPEPVYRFSQQLIQLVAEDSMVSRERRALHLRIADELAQRPGDQIDNRREELAHHYAEGGQVDAAVDNFIAAAQFALRWGSVQLASELADRAARLLEAEPAGAERDVRLLDAYILLSQTLNLYRGYSDPDYAVAVSRARELSAQVPAGSGEVAAIWMQWRLAYVTMQLRDAMECARKLEQIAALTENPQVRMIALSAQGVIEYMKGESAQAVATLEAFADLHRQLDPDMGGDEIAAKAAFFGHLFLGNALHFTGQIKRTAEHFDIAEEIANRIESVDLVLVVGFYRAMALLLVEDFDGSEQLNTANHDKAERHDIYHIVAISRIVSGWILLSRGQIDDAAAISQDLESYFESSNSAPGRLYLTMRMSVALAQNDRTEARRNAGALRESMATIGTQSFRQSFEYADLALDWPTDPGPAEDRARAGIAALEASGSHVPRLWLATKFADLLITAQRHADAAIILKEALVRLSPDEMSGTPLFEKGRALLAQSECAAGAQDPSAAANA